MISLYRIAIIVTFLTTLVCSRTVHHEQLSSILSKMASEDIPEYHAADIDPEAYMTVEEIIRYHGYPVTSYTVQTSDGYILTIQRISHGKAGQGSQPRKPVLIQHGLFCSSASWVTNIAEKNLPYLLADAGFDVWLGNVRGTLFGRNHTRLSPEKSKFWSFSYDEMATYDLPAVIDFIVATTGFNTIDYIGHSMGSTMAFALLSTQPQYNNIISTVYALAPLARAKGMRSPLKFLVPFRDTIIWWLDLFTTGEIMGESDSQLVKFLSKIVCTSEKFNVLCSNLLFLACGYNEAQMNLTRLPVHLHHSPAGTSLQTILHLAQAADADKFQWHDFGAKKNERIYGELIPPAYDLTNVKSKVALFWGANDLLSSTTDVYWLANNLDNLILKYQIPDPNFSHIDFLWANDVKSLLYNKIIEMMKKI